MPSVNKPDAISKSAYARHRGCSPANITKHIKAGNIPPEALTDDGKVIWRVADLAMARNADPSRKRDDSRPGIYDDDPEVDDMLADDGSGDSYQAMRTAKLSKSIQIDEIKIKRLQGELVEVGEVNAAAYEAGQLVQQRLEGFAVRAAPQLVGIETELGVRERLQNLIITELKDIAEIIEHGTPDPDSCTD